MEESINSETKNSLNILFGNLSETDEIFYKFLNQFFKCENHYNFRIFYPYNSIFIKNKLSLDEGVNLLDEEKVIFKKIFNIIYINGIDTQHYRTIDSSIQKNGLFFAIFLNFIENQIVFENKESYFFEMFFEEENYKKFEVFLNLLDQSFQQNMLICSVLNNQGFQNTKATIREKLTELKHIMTRENLSKEAILENLETYFLVPDNSQFLCIFIHIFLFAYIEFIYSNGKKFSEIKMKSLSEIYLYLNSIAFIEGMKINFHCLQAISNFFNIRINFVDMNCNTPNFITMYPIYNMIENGSMSFNKMTEKGQIWIKSKLLSVNFAIFRDKIFLFYSSNFNHECKKNQETAGKFKLNYRQHIIIFDRNIKFDY